MMINVIDAVLEIKKTNESFSYTAGKMEIANEIWHGFMSPADRLEIMGATNLDGLSISRAHDKCLKTIASMF